MKYLVLLLFLISDICLSEPTITNPKNTIEAFKSCNLDNSYCKGYVLGVVDSIKQLQLKEKRDVYCFPISHSTTYKMIKSYILTTKDVHIEFYWAIIQASKSLFNCNSKV